MKVFTVEVTKTLYVEVEADTEIGACDKLAGEMDDGHYLKSWAEANPGYLISETREKEKPATFTFELTKTINVEIDAENELEACAALENAIRDNDHDYSWSNAHTRSLLTHSTEDDE